MSDRLDGSAEISIVEKPATVRGLCLHYLIDADPIYLCTHDSDLTSSTYYELCYASTHGVGATGREHVLTPCGTDAKADSTNICDCSSVPSD